MEPETALRDLKWHVNYARKQQNKRLNEALESGLTIGQFLTRSSAEWALDDLIYQFNFYGPEIDNGIKQLEKKPFLERIRFWKK